MRIRCFLRLNCLSVIALIMILATISSSAIGVSTTPASGDEDVRVDDAIIITFDYPMDTATVNVTFDPDPGIGFARDWTNSQTRLKLTPSDSLSHDKKYTVSINGLQQDAVFVSHSFSFTTEEAPIEVGGINLTDDLPLVGFSLWNLIMFIVVLLIGLIVVKIVGRIVKKSLLRAKASAILAEFTSRFVKIFLLIFVIFTALAFLGLDIGEYILGLSVVMGFVLGFAFGDMLSNIASGFMVAITKPFKAGDFVTVSGESGVVQSVGISVTELDTPDNKRVIIPNKIVYGANIINFTRNPVRRVDMEAGVGYGDNLDKVVKATMEVINSHPKVLKDPAPQVAVKEHGDSAVLFVVRPWCKTEDYWDVFFDLKKALKEAYDKAGISIPFPQRDLHIIEGKL